MNNAPVRIRHWSLLNDPEKFKTARYYCWVSPVQPDYDFKGWMAQHCPTANCEFRFNSGDPIYTVSITDEKEALIFKLQWNTDDDAY